MRFLTPLAALAMTTAAHATDIEFWYGNTGSNEKAILAACEAFNASQDQDHVSCVGQGSYEAGMQKAIAAYRAGNHPVLIQFFDAGTLDLMLSGAVIPVSEAMPDAPWDSYIPGARAYYETADGKLFSQPYNSSTLLFYTNKAMLAEAGIEKTPETWEEVIAAARTLKEAGVSCPFATDINAWRQIEQFAARHGVPIATQSNGYDGLDAEYVIDQGIVAQHMNNLADWHEEGLVRFDAETKAAKYNAAFSAGECAMIEGSSGGYTSFTEALGADAITVTLPPMYEGQTRHNTFVGGASLWLMKGHDEAEVKAAQNFLDYLRTPEAQLEFTAATGYLPVTQSALDLLESSGRADAPEFATAGPGMETLGAPGNADTRGIRLGFYVQFRDIFAEETQRAYNGDITMDEALANSVRRGNELLRRFEATYAAN
ncbi:extracellular solute-binding protein [Falsirhodobacter xinxiangensis]|uniref:extracellular solute-binding protein n=1 Tax=Falsirhodobacter xinxiangensis TaxID=2530049 RepID=UPI0010A9A804|nr:extracellular solute-binding protein [Rhodobacter xinxiangensis]